MTQVLLNLFRNAIESMEGGGVLTVQTAYNSVIQVFQIYIKDTGRGYTAGVLLHACSIRSTQRSRKERGLGWQLVNKSLRSTAALSRLM